MPDPLRPFQEIAQLGGIGCDALRVGTHQADISYRPEFDFPWIGRPYVTALNLNRLGEREIAAIIDRVTGNKAVLESTRQVIIERTDGIPLFVEEMTKAVLEAEGDSWSGIACWATPCWLSVSSRKASLTSTVLLALYDPHRPLATRFGQDIGVAILSFRPFAQWILGYPETALAEAARPFSAAREMDHAPTLIFALACTTLTHTFCREYGIANAQLEEFRHPAARR